MVKVAEVKEQHECIHQEEKRKSLRATLPNFEVVDS
jgi:hypothetical protein